MIMKITKRLFSIILMAVMIATAFGFGTAPEVSAASGLPKVSSLNAAAGQTSVTLSWKKLSKKQQKKVKGIAIYRDNILVKTVSKKTKTFTDSGLEEGNAYSYTVKTYKATKKKEWFNTQTQRWQKKKPAKKWRGKSRKINKYSAGTTISVATGSAAPAAAPSVNPASTESSESKDPEFLNSYLPAAATYDLSERSHTFNVNSRSGVTWSSNDPSVAKPATGIEGAAHPGKINFVGAGTATLTVTSKASGETKSIRLTITDNNSGGGSGENPGTFKEFKVIEAPSTVDVKTAGYSIKVQLPADNFGISWMSADEDCVQINGSASNGVQNIIAKKKYGNITLLGTLTVPSGVNYTGNKTVKVVITNTVYPRNADGSYTLTSNGQYWWCGGVKVRIDDMFDMLPSGTTFKVNMTGMDFDSRQLNGTLG